MTEVTIAGESISAEVWNFAGDKFNGEERQTGADHRTALEQMEQRREINYIDAIIWVSGVSGRCDGSRLKYC